MKKEIEKEIEKAIRETLVIDNPQSINIAVKKILRLFDVMESDCDHEWLNHSFDHFGFLQEQICDKCGAKRSVP